MFSCRFHNFNIVFGFESTEYKEESEEAVFTFTFMIINFEHNFVWHSGHKFKIKHTLITHIIWCWWRERQTWTNQISSNNFRRLICVWSWMNFWQVELSEIFNNGRSKTNSFGLGWFLFHHAISQSPSAVFINDPTRNVKQEIGRKSFQLGISNENKFTSIEFQFFISNTQHIWMPEHKSDPFTKRSNHY